jgi:hypothetical protein
MFTKNLYFKRCQRYRYEKKVGRNVKFTFHCDGIKSIIEKFESKEIPHGGKMSTFYAELAGCANRLSKVSGSCILAWYFSSWCFR